jgi:hypothetical protein
MGILYYYFFKIQGAVGKLKAMRLRFRNVYSEVPNKSVTFFILLWNFFLPTWPYYDLHAYLFLEKFVTYTVFYIVNIKKFPPTCPY